ncbi:Non-ribosomal peptide synthetase [Desulfonema magnum]|uniref:Non-ribosomal peptide synthetase n=1 Tax=Desulfonema magnum TaxID=45655 RepID=A0A975BUF2_9BACT|nr:Non-ribosomal peptide synthetase [Desulfonema magnum]
MRYNAPENVLTPELFDQLRTRKAEILEFFRTKNIGSSSVSIEKIPQAEDYPVSHAQQRLWLLSQMRKGNEAYNMPSALALKGKVNRKAFQRAFTALIQRHESLRTSFVMADGELRQKIHDNLNFKVDFTDIIAETQPEKIIREKFCKEATAPFDLENGPLIRVSLYRISDSYHIMFFNMHHIISDGWSTGILAREFCQLYDAFSQKKPNPLPPLRIQYKDYAAWQNHFLKTSEIEIHRDYWHKKLSREIPILDLPTDFPRPPLQTFEGNTASFTLSPKQTERVREFNLKQGVSLYMTLLAVVKVLLYRYTGQKDIIVGSPIAGRNHADLEDQIGFYVNTLVLRNQIDENASFVSFLEQVRQTATEAYDHQVYPFDKLVDDLNLHRDMSRSPLFDILVIMQNNEAADLSLPELRIETLEQDFPISKFDLTFEFWEREDILVKLKYNTDLFREDRIKRMGTHFQTLTDSILKNADQPVCRLNMLTQDEQNLVVYQFNDTVRDYPIDKTVTDLIENQVEKTPDSTAVIFEDQQLTYRELNTRANQLSYHLKNLGAGPEVLIGICAERSLEMIVGIYGILKTGSAYVPLDPDYPSERLGFMIRDAGISLLLTQKHLAHRFSMGDIQIICLDTDGPAIAQLCEDNPIRHVSPDSPAYVVYTSGTTGQPKGVINTYLGLTNQLCWRQEFFNLTPSDSVLQKTPFSFDNSIWEMFWPLIAGARSVLAKPGGQKDSAYLVRLIIRHKITTIHFVPSMLRVFLETPALELCLGLKRCFSGGEPLSADLQEKFFTRLKIPLYNLYGQSEAAMNTTCWLCRQDSHQRGRIPIGRPISNIRIYILGQNMLPQPIGVPGEIYIGGRGIASGYLNRPGLDAEKFVSDPFSPDSESLLYRTGDNGCWLPDGNIEFTGRNDEQVKIRGYRIELQEIRLCLLNHEAVRESVVVVRDFDENKELVAYVVPTDPDKDFISDQIREHLKKTLPDYMVPSYVIQLAELPVTPNGKVDKNALPGPLEMETVREKEYIAPRYESERKLADIWQDILKVRKIGIRDNFFELGGHSLKAARMVNRIHKAFDVEINLGAFFISPTVEEMARQIHLKVSDHQKTPETFTPLACLQPNGERPPLFFIHIARGDVFCYAELSRQIGSDYPFYGLRAFGIEPGTSSLTHVEDMAAKYIESIRAVYPHGPYVIGGHSGGGRIAFEMAQQISEAGESVPLLIFIDAFAPDYFGSTRADMWEYIMTVYRDMFDLDILSYYTEIRGISDKIEDIRQDFESLSHEDMLNVLWQCRKKAGLLLSDVDTALQYRIFKLQIDGRLSRFKYKPLSYSGQIVLFRATENLTINQTDDETLGWNRHVSHIRIHDIPGADHITIVNLPYVKILAEKLKPYLEAI